MSEEPRLTVEEYTPGDLGEALQEAANDTAIYPSDSQIKDALQSILSGVPEDMTIKQFKALLEETC